ncbi:MAG: hypothetical protein JXC32_10240, partial [Anaerolineae bacterium]|nr:hypothetical protein [Anaerolineae bacterium]
MPRRDATQPSTENALRQAIQGLGSALSSNYQLLLTRLWRADLYGLRGVPPQHHAGMKAFWFDSLLASTSDGFYANYVSLYILALGGTRN